MWKALFFLVFASNIYLGSQFVTKFFDYQCQHAMGEVEVDHFDVQPGPEGIFFLQAAFENQGRLVEYRFRESFINEFVAQEAMEAMRQESWLVYKNSFDGTLSLQRYFPMKELFHLVLSLGVTVYFFWLYSYARRFAN